MTDLSGTLMIVEHLETGTQYAIQSETELFFNGYEYGYPLKTVSISREDMRLYYKIEYDNRKYNVHLPNHRP